MPKAGAQGVDGEVHVRLAAEVEAILLSDLRQSGSNGDAMGAHEAPRPGRGWWLATRMRHSSKASRQCRKMHRNVQAFCAPAVTVTDPNNPAPVISSPTRGPCAACQKPVRCMS